MSNLQRQYIDLIHQTSSKRVNWDPHIPIEVGTFGQVESSTGELQVEGNVYDPHFQVELDQLGLPLHMASYPPQESWDEDEEDFVVSSKGVKRIDLNLGPEASVAGFATAPIKGRWQFERGKRGALLIMHRPRLRFLPRNVNLDTLSKVPKLKNKWLVTSTHICPAFFMYLSDKSGKKVSLALVAQAPLPAAPGVSAGGEGGLGWQTDCQADLLRKACDKAGKYAYTPLYTMEKCRSGWRLFRGEIRSRQDKHLDRDGKSLEEPGKPTLKSKSHSSEHNDPLEEPLGEQRPPLVDQDSKPNSTKGGLSRLGRND